MVDLFIADDPRPIVTQKGRIGEKEEISHDIGKQYLTEPLVILVDRASASASEIVAGALKDFERAELVGETTFGKGSVQRVFTVPEKIAALVGGESSLRLTVQYYYLPNKDCIHTRRDADGAIIQEGGVSPDIEVSQPSLTLWKASEFEKLLDNGKLDEYIRSLLAGGSESDTWKACRALLEKGDAGDPARYPGFEAFFDSIKETVKLEPPDVRILLRSELKRAFEDEMGRELACDFQDDVQLQRAILEVLKELAVDPATIPEYLSFAPAKEKDGAHAANPAGGPAGGELSKKPQGNGAAAKK
jgi:hypothetical protein